MKKNNSYYIATSNRIFYAFIDKKIIDNYIKRASIVLLNGYEQTGLSLINNHEIIEFDNNYSNTFKLNIPKAINIESYVVEDGLFIINIPGPNNLKDKIIIDLNKVLST